MIEYLQNTRWGGFCLTVLFIVGLAFLSTTGCTIRPEKGLPNVERHLPEYCPTCDLDEWYESTLFGLEEDVDTTTEPPRIPHDRNRLR